MIHCRLDWQDGVQAVAVLLHTMSINVGGILNDDELPANFVMCFITVDAERCTAAIIVRQLGWH